MTGTTPAYARLSSIAVLCMGLTCVAVALWLGALAHTLLSVWSLFHAYPKAQSDVAVKAAPLIFYVSERANFVAGGVGLLMSLGWLAMTRGRAVRWVVGMLLLALALAAAQTVFISSRMDALREAGFGGGPEFMKLHGISNVQYLVQLVLLLFTTALLPTAIRSSRGKESAALTA